MGIAGYLVKREIKMVKKKKITLQFEKEERTVY
jgi:hypothetical protein